MILEFKNEPAALGMNVAGLQIRELFTLDKLTNLLNFTIFYIYLHPYVSVCSSVSCYQIMGKYVLLPEKNSLAATALAYY